MKKYLILLLAFIFFGCYNEEHLNEEIANEVFKPYLDLFIKEGASRNFDFNSHYVDFYFADITRPNTAGICYYGKNKIVIDKEAWNNNENENFREWLIFHELGHCILNRSHKNKKSNSGECLSIMKGAENEFDCSSNYTQEWRKYYLDELFNQKTNLPDWYFNNQQYNLNLSNKTNIINLSNYNTNFLNTNFNADKYENFIVEVTFKNWNQPVNNPQVILTNQIEVDGFYISCAPIEKEVSMTFNGETLYHTKVDENYVFKNNMKVTIRKTNNYISLFIDEKFFHVANFNSIDKDIIRIVCNNPLNLDVKVFEFQ